MRSPASRYDYGDTFTADHWNREFAEGVDLIRNPPRCRIRGTTDYTAALSVDNQVSYQTTDDVRLMSTTGNRIIAQQPGLYWVTSTVPITGGSTSQMQGALLYVDRLNSADAPIERYRFDSLRVRGGSFVTYVHGGHAIPLNAGEKLQSVVRFTGGAYAPTISTFGDRRVMDATWISGFGNTYNF